MRTGTGFFDRLCVSTRTGLNTKTLFSCFSREIMFTSKYNFTFIFTIEKVGNDRSWVFIPVYNHLSFVTIIAHLVSDHFNRYTDLLLTIPYRPVDGSAPNTSGSSKLKSANRLVLPFNTAGMESLFESFSMRLNWYFFRNPKKAGYYYVIPLL